jgi:hypothetical protein
LRVCAKGRITSAVQNYGWLKYDTRQGGFVIDLDRSRLEKAPSYMASNMPNWSDRTYGSRIDEFYSVPPYWGVIWLSSQKEGNDARPRLQNRRNRWLVGEEHRGRYPHG